MTLYLNSAHSQDYEGESLAICPEQSNPMDGVRFVHHDRFLISNQNWGATFSVQFCYTGPNPKIEKSSNGTANKDVTEGMYSLSFHWVDLTNPPLDSGVTSEFINKYLTDSKARSSIKGRCLLRGGESMEFESAPVSLSVTRWTYEIYLNEWSKNVPTQCQFQVSIKEFDPGESADISKRNHLLSQMEFQLDFDISKQ